MILIIGSGCHSEVPAVDVKAENGVSPVTFTLRGKPKITRAVHSHSPILSGRGKDSYRFRGKIEYNGLAVDIDVDAVPILMIKLSKDFFLLTQDYFIAKRFQWHVIKDNGLEDIPIESLPRELWYINFDDQEVNWLYKVCLIGKNIDNPRIVIDLFDKFVADNPRCLLRKFRVRMPARTALVDLLNKMAESPDHYSAVSPSLWGMLLAAEPTDDPQDVQFIGFTIVELNAEFARENLPKLFERIIAEKIIDDWRILGLKPVINQINGKEDIYTD